MNTDSWQNQLRAPLDVRDKTDKSSFFAASQNEGFHLLFFYLTSCQVVLKTSPKSSHPSNTEKFQRTCKHVCHFLEPRKKKRMNQDQNDLLWIFSSSFYCFEERPWWKEKKKSRTAGGDRQVNKERSEKNEIVGTNKVVFPPSPLSCSWYLWNLFSLSSFALSSLFLSFALSSLFLSFALSSLFLSFALSSLFAFNYGWGRFIFTVTEYFLPSFFSPPPHPSITTSHLTLCPREEELSHAIPSISLLFLLQIVSEESEKSEGRKEREQWGKKRARKEGREKVEMEGKEEWKEEYGKL